MDQRSAWGNTNNNHENQISETNGYSKEENIESDKLTKEQKIKNINLNSSITLWTERWFLSTNAKDIGTLYLIFALFSGLLGTAFSVLIRMELSGPGVQYIADNQLYNSIITAHALLMIFFMVEINYMFKLLGGAGPLTLFYDTGVNNNNNPSAFILQYNKNTFEKTEPEKNQDELVTELVPKKGVLRIVKNIIMLKY